MSNSSVVLIHQKTQQRYPLKSEFVIGRSAGDLVFDQDPKLSGKHCLIRSTDAGFAIYDLKSRTGVYINGAQLPQGRACILKNGSQITIGDQIFIVRDEAAAAAAGNWKLFLPAVFVAFIATASLPFVESPKEAPEQARNLPEISRRQVLDAEMREAIIRLEALKNPEASTSRSDQQKLTYLRDELIPRFLNLHSQLQALPAPRPELSANLEQQRHLANAFLGEVTAMAKFLENKDLRYEREATEYERQAQLIREQLQKDQRLPASQ